MIDEDTQRLIERTRQRRELLNQRFAGMPEAAPRKRRTPVFEADCSDKVLSEKSQNQDDLSSHQSSMRNSPKRQCLREEERHMKADTPAIQSVQSRRKALITSEDSEMEMNPVPVPRKSVSSPPQERKSNQSPQKSPMKAAITPASTRKTRFAQLAQSINDWEDDMSHHIIHREDEKKPRWQPPKAVSSSPAKSPSKGTANNTSSSSISAASAVSSPKRTPAPLGPSMSDTGLARNSTLRSSKVCTPSLSASTPAPSVAKPVPTSVKATPLATSVKATPVQSTKKPAPNDPSELSISQRREQMHEKLANVTPKARTKDEPTAYSVGARMSAWENTTASNLVSSIKKVNPGEATPVTKPKPSVHNTPKVDASNKDSESRATPAHVKSFKDSIQQKAGQVWAKKGVSIDQASPTKTVHSPTKVSGGTKAMQQMLVGRSQESETTCSNLAAQSRAARLAELEAIQNRWKNGVLKSDADNSDASSVGPKPTIDAPPASGTPFGGRREEARNKARADFNSKLAEIGLDGEAAKPSTTKAATPARPPPPVVKASVSDTGVAPGRTGSIYSLIKKREDTPMKNKANDSFDDLEEELEKIPRTALLRAAKQASFEKEEQDGDFKKPPTPENKQVPDRDSVISSSDAGEEEFGSTEELPMDINDDDISLRGFVSEAVRRESILPPAGLRRDSSQSSLDSYASEQSQGKSGSAAQQGGYQPDDESMEDEEEDDDEGNDRAAMDELLDEAIVDMSTAGVYDPDMDPNNVVLRSKKPAYQESSDEYDPDMDPNNVVLRRKPQATSTYPVPAMRHKLSIDTTTDEDDDRPYSLQAYRKSAHVMMQPVVRASRYVGREVQEEDPCMPSSSSSTMPPRRDDKRAVQERIKELQELVQQEQNIIMQTSNALNKCCMGTNAYFAGSTEQVECNRLLLLACQKRQNYLTEIQRMKSSGIINNEGPGPKGSLTISDIRLPLKKEFVTKIGTSHDNTTHFFILLIRNGCQLICTQMLSTHDPMMRGSLDFPNLIKINGITGSFKLTMDIYSMSVSREASMKDKKKKTPKKNKGYAMHLESPGGPSAVRTTSFSQVTSLTLTMKSLDKHSFHLERLPYLSPLYGQIFMRLKCFMDSNVEEKGFLTMFDDVSGFGAWHRRWCVLAGNKLCVWKYPDDETRKDPMAMIDLKRCITEKVGLVPRDICARPNTFELVTVRQPLKGEHDTLVTRTHNTMTAVRHQMSADSKEERIVWCNKLNKTLANLRTWNADALKPTSRNYPSAR